MANRTVVGGSQIPIKSGTSLWDKQIPLIFNTTTMKHKNVKVYEAV